MIDKFILVINEQQVIDKVFYIVLHQNYHMIIRLDNVFQLRYTLLYIISGKKYHFLNWQPFNPFLLEI